MTDDAGRGCVVLRLFRLPDHETKQLANAMCDIPVMSDPDSRQRVVERVRERDRKFDPEHSKRTNEAIMNIIIACKEDDESFDLLLSQIEIVDSGDPGLANFKQLAQALLPRSALAKVEFLEFLDLGAKIASADQIAGWIQQVPYDGGAGRHDFVPGKVREAALLLLDHSRPGEGVYRLLGFVEWLACVAAIAGGNEQKAEKLRDWAKHVRDAHGLPPVSSVRAGSGPIGLAAENSSNGAFHQNDEATQESLADSTAPSEMGSGSPAEHGAKPRERPKYLIGDGREVFPKNASPHERSLQYLKTRLVDIKPEIFRQSALKGELLRAAERAVRLAEPLITAVDEAASRESRDSRRVCLQDLAKDLRDGQKEVSRLLSKLSVTRSERSARGPCDDLAESASRWYAHWQLAIQLVT